MKIAGSNPAGGTELDIILPVAGLGTRLRPQTWSKPKPLVSIAGKTILEHVLDRVMVVEPEKIVLITGFRADDMVAWADENLTVEVEFVHQPKMLGQTDAIVRAREVSRKDALILFPDALFEGDFSNLATVDADVVMYTKVVEDPSALGIAVVEDGRIVKLVEKPKDLISKLAVIGIYYVRSMPALYAAIDEQMARGITTKGEYFIADAIQLMIDNGAKVISQEVTFWEDAGNTEALLATNAMLLDRGAGVAGTALRGDSVVIGPSAVHPDAVIESSVVGPHASIAAGVVIRNSVVSDAIVEAGAHIAEAVVRHSLVGRSAVVTGSAKRLNVGDNSVVTL